LIDRAGLGLGALGSLEAIREEAIPASEWLVTIRLIPAAAGIIMIMKKHLLEVEPDRSQRAIVRRL
jgi:hypothetical protein